MKKDPVGKKRQRTRNTFKKVNHSKKNHTIKYTDCEDLDKKINALQEDNKLKKTIIEQVGNVLRLKKQSLCLFTF